jgi:hypothetical protein
MGKSHVSGAGKDATVDPDILSVRITSDMHRALLAPKEALHLLERLLRLHDARNQPPF